MTTIIFDKKKKYLAWDKKFVWWINIEWLESKIWTVEITKNFIIHYWMSWTCLMRELIELTIKSFFNTKNPIIRLLYSFKEEIEKLTNEQYWFILCITIFWETKAYYFQKSHCEEITRDFISMWSWEAYALWMRWLDNDVDVKKIFEVVSSLDKNTSKEFDIINF